MTFELVGSPKIELYYSDEYETTMVCQLRRNDGVTGDVWIVAGVPEHSRKLGDGGQTQASFQDVRVLDYLPDNHWCPKSLRTGHDDIVLAEIKQAVLAMVKDKALAVHGMARWVGAV